MTDCKIKVLHNDLVLVATSWGTRQLSCVTRDCTVGKVYIGRRLEKGGVDNKGCLVMAEDCVEFTDDVGDTVTTYPFAGIEIVEG